MQKLKNIKKYAKISDTPFDQRSLIHREAWFPGGPRILKNPIFWKNGKNHPKRKNAKISDTPFNQRSLILQEVWFPPCFVRQNPQQQKKLFVRGDFRPLPNKNVQMLDHFFLLLFPKYSKSLKILDIQFWEVGAKRPLNGTSKVNGQTDTHTHTQTDKSTYRKHRPRADALKIIPTKQNVWTRR